MNEETMNEELTTMTGKEHRAVLKRLMSYTKYHIPLLLFTGFLVLLVTAAEVISPLIVRSFLDNHLTPLSFEMKAVLVLASAYIGLEIGKFVVWYFQLFFFQKIALEIVQRIRVDIFF